MKKKEKLIWKFEKLDNIRIKNFIRNKQCLEDYISDRGGMEYSYTLVINKIEIAFKLLCKNNEFKKIDINEFIESNDLLYASEHFRLWLKMYGLPNSFVLLLELNIFEKALKYLEKTLKKYDLIKQYNEQIKNLENLMQDEGMVV
ncbi:MAG: hypothetical protein ACI35S_07300 [Anaeroplasma sp.]